MHDDICNHDVCTVIAAHCRERASGVYGTPAYFTATVLFDLIPMRVLPPCFFAAATYWMVGLRPGLWHLLTFLLLLVLSNMVGTLSSLFFSICLRQLYKHANQAAVVHSAVDATHTGSFTPNMHLDRTSCDIACCHAKCFPIAVYLLPHAVLVCAMLCYISWGCSFLYQSFMLRCCAF